MKVAPKLILLYRDPEGFGASLYDALQPTPNSSLHRLDESFELSLERYGIRDHTACGDITHFVDQKGQLSVSVLLMQYCQPPFLGCAVNEVLASIVEESLQGEITLTLPFVIPAPKLKGQDQSALTNNKSSIYGVHVGPATDFTQAILSKARALPSSLQIHHEHLACLLQFARVLKFPTALLIGLRDQMPSSETSREELQVLHEMGELLAGAFSLGFLGDRIKLNIGNTSTVAKEPWRAFYY
ncbi:hypothetical protein Ancab_008205 [Ancistrocladus abbreviatus]